MKIYNILRESDDESDTVADAPSPGQLGDFITTAQAAKILDVSMSRVRQLIMTNKIHTYSPVPGRRDNFLKLDDIHKYKSDRDDKKADKENENES